MAHPQPRKKTAPTRPALKRSTAKPVAVNKPVLSAAAPQTRPIALAQPSPKPMLSASPTTRTASAASAVRGQRRDLPYGIPVPNRPGFVTSPYSPGRGLVDVRSFPTGTEVQDPYSGKIFLTP